MSTPPKKSTRPPFARPGTPSGTPSRGASGGPSRAPTGGPSRGPATPRPRPGQSASPPAAAPIEKPRLRPLNDTEMAQLEALLDSVPAPLEPLDVSMLDGYLVGVLLQPKAVPAFQWSRYVLDSEGRPAPAGFDSHTLMNLVKRRYQELNQAIVDRQWFDPWVFELEDEAEPSEVLFPWVAGFALATDVFPDLLRGDPSELLEPLAALFMHLDPDDLEDADDLLEEIETLEPPSDVSEAVESLVSACLMLADTSRPQHQAAAPQRPPARRGPPQRGRY
ncbi:YecA/YgfB family protein [Roseateles koreensis]|uniref:YecA family protein n=1 Tax=Roseateles koreensis TaxID=2987526 RepID=A0ABT5KPM3_9BURK|nr:YecA family protein [Roseateles koreensis]MDC8784812.1 YecA family protein [Roseateles koreensis]